MRPAATPSGRTGLASTSGVSETQDHDDIAGAREGSRCRGLGRTEGDELAGAAGGPVPDGQGEAGPGEVGGHRRAHRPESHEADPFHRPPPPAVRSGYSGAVADAGARGAETAAIR